MQGSSWLTRALAILLLAALAGCAPAPPPGPGPEPPPPVADKGGAAPDANGDPAGHGHQPPDAGAPTDVSQRIPFVTVDLSEPSTGWALSTRGVWRTTNGGQNWAQVTPSDLTGGPGAGAGGLAARFPSARAAWVADWNDTGGVTVFTTGDGGRTWTAAPVTRSAASLVYGARLHVLDAERAWLMLEPEHGMSSSPGELYATTDGGRSWAMAATPEQLPFGGDVAFRTSQDGWVAGHDVSTQSRRLLRTRDGGRTWQEQPLPAPSGLGDGKLDVAAAPVFFGPAGQDGLLIATWVPDNHQADQFGTLLYVTADGGDTWQVRSQRQPQGPVAFAGAADGWHWQARTRQSAGEPVRGQLFRTRDGGRSWAPVPPDATLAAQLQRGRHIVALDFAAPDTGWALLAGPDGGTAGLLHTTDGGATWAVATHGGGAADRGPLLDLAGVQAASEAMQRYEQAAAQAPEQADELFRQLLAWMELHAAAGVQYYGSLRAVAEAMGEEPGPALEQVNTTGLRQPETIPDPELRQLARRMAENALAFATAEGDVWPTLDYSALHERFGTGLSAALREYLAIRAAQLNIWNEGFLTIAWDGLAERLVEMERYLSAYPEAAEAAETVWVYDAYRTQLLHYLRAGTWRTGDPVGDDAQESFARLSADHPNTRVGQIAAEYLALLGRHDFRMAPAVEDYLVRLNKELAV